MRHPAAGLIGRRPWALRAAEFLASAARSDEKSMNVLPPGLAATASCGARPADTAGG
jgi:hypothetical protein